MTSPVVDATPLGTALHTAHAAVDTNTMLIAGIIFLITYIVILSERVNRAIVAMLGGGLMVLVGVMTQAQATAAIDANTIGLLLGMMVIVAITKESGIFQAVAIWSAQAAKAKPLGVLAMISVITAVFSALLDNVTTVLLMTPVILLITRELNVKPYPFLFAAILSSNIGGSATLIGDPPNILIGSAANLSFLQFLNHMAPLAVVVFVLTLIPILLIWRKDLVTEERHSARIMKMDAKSAIEDYVLLYKSLGVLLFVMLGFVFGHTFFHIEPATFAVFGAALLLLLDNVKFDAEKQNHRVHNAFAEAEWVTLFFFMGLFVLVHGIEQVGIIQLAADKMIALTNGNLEATAMAVLWGSAILSALVDNIPFVATMIPLLQTMIPDFNAQLAGSGTNLWWILAIGACLGGNGSLIGASANLVVAGFAEKAGHPISFVKFMLYGFPLMLWSILIATGYVYLRYL